MQRLMLAAAAAFVFLLANDTVPARAAADQCATQYRSCQFPCAATNTDAGLACVNKCIAQRDACYAAQPKPQATQPAQKTTSPQADKKKKDKEEKKKKKDEKDKKKDKND